MEEVRAVAEPPRRVVITDVDVPFWSLVGLMLKWALASIPAYLLLGTLWLMASALVSGFATGIREARGIGSAPTARASAISWERALDDCRGGPVDLDTCMEAAGYRFGSDGWVPK